MSRMEVSYSEEDARLSRVGGTEEGGGGVEAGPVRGGGVTVDWTRGVDEKAAVWCLKLLDGHFDRIDCD